MDAGHKYSITCWRFSHAWKCFSGGKVHIFSLNSNSAKTFIETFFWDFDSQSKEQLFAFWIEPETIERFLVLVYLRRKNHRSQYFHRKICKSCHKTMLCFKFDTKNRVYNNESSNHVKYEPPEYWILIHESTIALGYFQ